MCYSPDQLDGFLYKVINVISRKENTNLPFFPQTGTINVNHVEGYRKPKGASSHKQHQSLQCHDDSSPDSLL